MKVPRFGYTHDDIWAKITIENPGFEVVRYFEFSAPIEKVWGYLVKNDQVDQKVLAGMLVEIEKESFISKNSHPVLKLNIPSGVSTLYFQEDAVAPHFP